MIEYNNILNDERNKNCGEPGMGDINVMVKPSVLKDKTPMCLVNELARHNRIQHQYRLTKEDGPPHRKKFTVTLKLGDSEFEAQGTSIKKAQHEAAAIALRNTKYKHPPPKLLPNTRVHMTPTVELNALAMKRGEPAVYTTLSQPITAYFHPPSYPINYYARNMYQTRTMYNDYGYNEVAVMNSYSYTGTQYNSIPFKCALPYKISLKVGDREYIGEGTSAQAARHKAAKKALEDLRTLSEKDKNESADPQRNESFKSPISAVHEKAFRHNLQASFEVIEERGPPHMKTFITECRVGEQFRTIGEGNGKKLSKRRAAEKMLKQLESLPPPPRPPINTMDRKRFAKRMAFSKSQNRNKDKVNGSGDNKPSEGDKQLDDVNPTTVLMEYQKKRHAKEPVFVLVGEKGEGRRKRFSIEVKVDDLSCVGAGFNKKIAKRQASANMLKLLGIDMNVAPKVDVEEPTASTEERIEVNTSTSPINGKQIAPGILLVPYASVTPKSMPKKSPKEEFPLTNGSNSYMEQKSLSPQYTDEKCKFLDNLDIQKETAKEQLIRLADKFGYEVQVADFPKGHHHKEFLTLITLNTNPPQTYYGAGSSTEKAQNAAAFSALSMISEMGVENLFTKKISAFVPEKEVVS